MSNHAFAAITRRASVLTLGGAGAALAATAASPDVGVAKKKKKVGKICKKKEKKRCNNDAAQCRVDVLAFCEGAPSTCIVLASPCCDECSASGLLFCLIVATASVATTTLG